MFNNNNYLPDLNHYPPTGQLSADASVPPAPANLEPPPPTMPPITGFGHSGNFRFLSPTQGTAVPTWMPPASIVSTISAPGTGASWQHSVPVTMPWANHIAPHFTAQNAPSQSLPVYTMPVGYTPQTTMMQVTPKPSIRCLRLKRRFCSRSSDDTDGPSSKRYLSEKMANWFKQLQITPSEGQSGKCRATGGASNQAGGPSRLGNGWQRFQEVEERLGQGLDDCELEMSSEQDLKKGKRDFPHRDGRRSVWTNGSVLKISDDVKKDVKNLEPVLPEQIMKTIRNPCMDLVLWKPPESIITTYLHQSPGSTGISSQSGSHGNSSSSSSCSLGGAQAAKSATTSSTEQPKSSPGSCVSGSVFGVGVSKSNGSTADMDAMEFYDCVGDDDDMDL